LGGVVGPAAFIAAWGIASAVQPGYSVSNDAISELAAVGADTRAFMTGGFVVFALCIFPYALAVRHALGGRVWLSAAVMGVATLVVAATPLGLSPATDHRHGVIAVIGYIALAATPLLAVRPLLDRDRRRAAAVSIVTAALSATALLLSDTTPLTGLFQRIGLTAGQLWIACSAVAMLAGAAQANRSEPADAAIATRSSRAEATR
jgi:hypothetical membrane protein